MKKAFDKIEFNEARKERIKSEVETITETVGYRLTKTNGIYTLERKKDKAKVVLLKDKVEDYVLWGKKEFNREAINTKF